jgi:hypothetical protein
MRGVITITAQEEKRLKNLKKFQALPVEKKREIRLKKLDEKHKRLQDRHEKKVAKMPKNPSDKTYQNIKPIREQLTEVSIQRANIAEKLYGKEKARGMGYRVEQVPDETGKWTQVKSKAQVKRWRNGTDKTSSNLIQVNEDQIHAFEKDYPGESWEHFIQNGGKVYVSKKFYDDNLNDKKRRKK